MHNRIKQGMWLEQSPESRTKWLYLWLYFKKHKINMHLPVLATSEAIGHLVYEQN